MTGAGTANPTMPLGRFKRYVRAIDHKGGTWTGGMLFLIALLWLAPPALANETVVYTYDELGRLIATSASGTINNGQTVSTSFDPAGNRTNFAVNGVIPANLAISDANVTEGGSLVFTVTRSGNTASSVISCTSPRPLHVGQAP